MLSEQQRASLKLSKNDFRIKLHSRALKFIIKQKKNRLYIGIWLGGIFMESSERGIFDKLSEDETSIEILKFCEFARPTRQIIDHIYHLGKLGSQRNKVMIESGRRLSELEGLKAIEYSNNSKSWTTTKLGKKVLSKFFT